MEMESTPLISKQLRADSKSFASQCTPTPVSESSQFLLTVSFHALSKTILPLLLLLLFFLQKIRMVLKSRNQAKHSVVMVSESDCPCH